MMTTTLKPLASSAVLSAVLSAASLIGCDPGVAVEDESAASASVASIETASIKSALGSSTGYGWVYTSSPSGTYTPHSDFAYNSSGGTMMVQQLGTGYYKVLFNGLDGSRGNAQVVAYGEGSERCKVLGWGGDSASTSVFVMCHAVTGALVDSRFVVQFQNQTATAPGAQWGAYLWSSEPGASHTPPSQYQWNANGALNTVVYQGTGRYQAVIPGHTGGLGSVNVTAYGSGSEQCKVAGWYATGGNTYIHVSCFDTSGAPVNSRFTLRYFIRNSYPGVELPTGFAWANDTSACPSIPATAYQFNTMGATNRGCRFSSGFYFTTFPKLPAGGVGGWGVPFSSTAMVTAYGNTSHFCKLSLWGNSGDGAEVRSRCFTAAGALVDTQFTIAFNNNEFPPPG